VGPFISNCCYVSFHKWTFWTVYLSIPVSVSYQTIANLQKTKHIKQSLAKGKQHNMIEQGKVI